MHTKNEKAEDAKVLNVPLRAQVIVQGRDLTGRLTLGRGECRGVRLRPLRGKARWMPTLTLAVALGMAGAQTSAPPPPSLTTEVGTRSELLELLRRVDTQLAEMTEGERQVDVERLLELKAQFEVLLLQAELEALRRENAELQEQREAGAQARDSQMESEMQNGSGQTGERQGSAGSQVEGEITGMRRQFARLGEQQANVTSQLETIASQHAVLLEQLGGAEQNPAERLVSAQQDEQSSQLQAELSELRDQFARLNAQQDIVNSQLQTVTDDHAVLLEQLGSAPQNTDTQPTGVHRTHVVRAGDSLSKLSKAYYGTGARWPEILRANPLLTDPDQLFAGTVVIIP